MAEKRGDTDSDTRCKMAMMPNWAIDLRLKGYFDNRAKVCLSILTFAALSRINVGKMHRNRQVGQ